MLIAMGTIVKDTILGLYKSETNRDGMMSYSVGQVASYHPVIASQPDGVTDGFYAFAQFPYVQSKNTLQSAEICDWIDRV